METTGRALTTGEPNLSFFLCSPEHIGQIVAWGRAHGPDGNVVDGAEALARANVGSVATRYRLDLAPDWESKVAQKFGGHEDIEQYIRLCVVESLQPCTLTARSIFRMAVCLDYQSREFAEWRCSHVRGFLLRITRASFEASDLTMSAVEWSYKCEYGPRRSSPKRS